MAVRQSVGLTCPAFRKSNFLKPTTLYNHKMALQKLNFITGNKNKLLEVRAILGNVIEVDSQAIDVPEIQGTVEEIAKEKAKCAAKAVGSLEIQFDRCLNLLTNHIDQWPGLD
jgi:inosine/xanthosine triphosphate pyrophosphatase family protein